MNSFNSEYYAIPGYAEKPKAVATRRANLRRKVLKREGWIYGRKEWGHNNYTVVGKVPDPENWTALEVFLLVDTGTWGGNVHWDKTNGDFRVKVSID